MIGSWVKDRLGRAPRLLNVLHFMKLIGATSQTNSDELSALAHHAKDARLALEIGSYQGVSAVVIARSMSAIGTLYCVDPWTPEKPGKHPCMSIFERHTRRAGVAGKLRVLQDVSSNVFQQLPSDFDFVFVDGDHSLNGIVADWALVKAKLRPGGIVCLHDVLVPSDAPWRVFGSSEYFEAIIRHDREFTIVEKVYSLAALRRR